MATEPDPYRTLGLPRTASLAEVKAAYRRLAKANHPDAAGESALPRFLAIQAAYERLVGPTVGRPRRASSTTPAPAPRQPWEADPDRSDATRRAYGGRARRPAGSPSGKTTGRPKDGAAGRAGTAGPASPNGEASDARDAGGSKDPKKATLGSTSYDEADREAFEPDWVGASWYGTTSGTYWTINPKEYADPRKHGPEYQARARRAEPGRQGRGCGDRGGARARARSRRAHRVDPIRSGPRPAPPARAARRLRAAPGWRPPRMAPTPRPAIRPRPGGTRPRARHRPQARRPRTRPGRMGPGHAPPSHATRLDPRLRPAMPAMPAATACPGSGGR